jgi:hypothetical protein
MPRRSLTSGAYQLGVEDDLGGMALFMEEHGPDVDFRFASDSDLRVIDPRQRGGSGMVTIGSAGQRRGA